MDSRFQCKAVRSPRGATRTEIDWGDGHKSIYPHDILRGYCPCAGCQGHTGAIKFQYPSENQIALDAIVSVGNYALRLTWHDGHDGGIYSYTYLRALCYCDECRPGADNGFERSELPRP
ncbi:MAG: DUF971 domain-containing protein [Polyangiaceae bacterium]|nr:DUF971 domain-containing protein [Polyangiaceae bacterium]